jgi:NAD(P)H-hydrate epimerase
MRVLTVGEMRRVEAAADESGHSYAAMMERAGRGVAEALMARQSVKGQRILVLVGPGNNGGDGLVAARYLAEAGAEVACYLLKPRADDDPNFKAVRERELFVADATSDQRWQGLRRLIAGADVIVDALLGTGVRLPLQGTVVQLLEQVSAGLQARRAEQAAARTLKSPARPPTSLATALVVAVDGPSGLDYDNGDLDPGALPADLTVTFAYPKPGHFLFPGAAACGDLIVADIGVSPPLTRELLGPPTLEVATAEQVGALLPDRPRDAHKGTFGKALLVVGSINYTGAAYLAASGATRVGTGLVTLAVPAAIHGALAAQISETTYLILPQVMGVIAPDAVGLLVEKMVDYQAMLLGPGLTQEKETVEFVHKLLQAPGPPKRRGRIGFQAGNASQRGDYEGERSLFPALVVDADGLNALTDPASSTGAAVGDEAWWRRLPSPSVLTPHPGEMARLMGVGTEDVQGDRLGAAREMAGRWGHVIVLKGAHTVVAAPDGRVVILPFATPALASAGSGDVLAGAIVGLLAQGLAPFDAALAGAYLHGLAGSWAGEEIGPAGAVASDLLPRLPRALRAIR